MDNKIERPRRKLPNLGRLFSNNIEESLQREVYRNLNNTYHKRLRMDKENKALYYRRCIRCKVYFQTDNETRVRCNTCYHSNKTKGKTNLFIVPKK